MHKITIFTFILLFPIFAQAQELPGAGLNQFYRPVQSGDLFTNLPPRTGALNSLASNGGNSFFSGSGGGCPENIIIGSIDGDTPVFGGVDIDVSINGDITIVCE